MKTYLVIFRNEDEPHVYFLTEEALRAALRPGEMLAGKTFLEGVSVSQFTGYGTLDLERFPPNTVLIFEGKQITPVAKTTVTAWELP